MQLKNKKILIIGGSGLLGSALLKLLDKLEIDYWAPRSSEMNVLNKENMEGIFSCYRPEVVFNLYVSFGGILGNKNHPGKIFYDNLIGNVNIIECCRKYKVRKLIQISSQCVYGDITPTPFNEEDIWSYGLPTDTNKTYGVSKRILHVMLEAYKEEYGLNSIVLIPCNLIGENDNFHPTHSHVAPTLIRRFIEAKESGAEKVEIWGTGESTRELLYTKDAARALVLAAEHYDEINPINIGTGKSIKIKDLAELIKELTGYNGDIWYNENGMDGQAERLSNVKKAKELFAFEAYTDLREALKNIIEWFLQNRNNLRETKTYE